MRDKFEEQADELFLSAPISPLATAHVRVRNLAAACSGYPVPQVQRIGGLVRVLRIELARVVRIERKNDASHTETWVPATRATEP